MNHDRHRGSRTSSQTISFSHLRDRLKSPTRKGIIGGANPRGVDAIHAHEVEVAISRADYFAALAFFGLGVAATEMPGIVGYVVTEETADGDLPANRLGRKVDICFYIPEEGMHLADAMFAETAHPPS